MKMKQNRQTKQSVDDKRRQWCSGKKSTCNAGDTGDVDSVSGLGRSPGVGNHNWLQYSCLENPVDREAWQATVRGVAESQARLMDRTRTAQRALTPLVTWCQGSGEGGVSRL